MLFTPIKTPNLHYVPERTDSLHSYVLRTDHKPYIEDLGLHHISDVDDRWMLLNAWIQPQSSLPIHRDISPRGKLVPWSIVICPISSRGVTLEIYEPIVLDNLESVTAPSGKHSVPSLNKKDAKLIEQWPMSQGAALFDPGQNWHSARNDTNQWQNCMSIRSVHSDHLEVLEKIKEALAINGSL